MRGASGLDDDRDDHRAAAVGVVDPLAHPAADGLLQAVGVVDALRQGVLQRLDDQRPQAVEDVLVLDEAAGVDVRSAVIVEVWVLTTVTMEMKPSSPRIRRSVSADSVMFPTVEPSTKM